MLYYYINQDIYKHTILLRDLLPKFLEPFIRMDTAVQQIQLIQIVFVL